MLSTTGYRRGDIVLVSFPFTDLTTTKKRPALVISPDFFNNLQQDLVLVAITSQLADEPHTIVLEEEDFEEGKLPKKSMVKLAKIFTIHSSLVIKKVCRLKQTKTDKVLKEVQSFFS